MSFSVSDALAVCTANINNRIKTRSTAYVLYYTNSNNRYDGKITGFTIKQLISEFQALGTSYQFAYITRVNEDKPLWFFNRSLGKKFYSMTRTGGKRKKAA